MLKVAKRLKQEDGGSIPPGSTLLTQQREDMAIYEYDYTTQDGEEKSVEIIMGMDDRADTAEVTDEDGETYTASRREISLNANMRDTWLYDRSAADLPPIDAKPEDGF